MPLIFVFDEARSRIGEGPPREGTRPIKHGGTQYLLAEESTTKETDTCAMPDGLPTRAADDGGRAAAFLDHIDGPFSSGGTRERSTTNRKETAFTTLAADARDLIAGGRDEPPRSDAIDFGDAHEERVDGISDFYRVSRTPSSVKL